jgi:multidrug transporter EmrE-like cation transporter
MVSEMVIKLMFFAMIFIAVSFEVVADVLFKKWAIGNKSTLLIVGLLIYFAGTVFWAISLKYEFLSKAVSVFTVLNLIVVVLAGVILFKEDLSLINKLGICLGILSVILIEI